MSPVSVDFPVHEQHAPPLVKRMDDGRGTWGMALFITTEAMLFILLFFAYYFTKKGTDRWHLTEPPKLHYSIPMLAILLTSSAVLHWGEKNVKQRNFSAGRIGVIGTMVLGLGFLTLTAFEYMEGFQHVTPRTDAYGSTFYTIVSLHAAHVILGLLMLTWLLIVPRWEPARYTPHRPYHNVSMYWHFVDTVWVFIVLLLYIIPNIWNAAS